MNSFCQKTFYHRVINHDKLKGNIIIGKNLTTEIDDINNLITVIIYASYKENRNKHVNRTKLTKIFKSINSEWKYDIKYKPYTITAPMNSHIDDIKKINLDDDFRHKNRFLLWEGSDLQGSFADDLKLSKTKTINFSMPDYTAILLNESYKKHNEFENMFKPKLDEKIIEIYQNESQLNEKHNILLFDVYQNIISQIIFSFTALESFINEVIHTMQASFKDIKDGEVIEQGIKQPNLELKYRYLVFKKVKGNNFIPEIDKNCSFYKFFNNLRKIRNDIIHANQIKVGSDKLNTQKIYQKIFDMRNICFYKETFKIIEEICKYNCKKDKFPRWVQAFRKQIINNES